MNATNQDPSMPAEVRAIVECGFAIWASNSIDEALRGRFNPDRIPVADVRHVRVWGLQVDDERELPGHERTQIPDEEIWEINLVSTDGSKYALDSGLLKPAP